MNIISRRILHPELCYGRRMSYAPLFGLKVIHIIKTKSRLQTARCRESTIGTALFYIRLMGIVTTKGGALSSPLQVGEFPELCFSMNMNQYCPNCGEDGDVFICADCGKQKCFDCISEKELISGLCPQCLLKGV